MNLTAHQIARITEELSVSLPGSFLNKVFQTAGDEWVLELRDKSTKRWLLFSASPRHSRVHLISNAPQDKVELDPFAKQLKKTLQRRMLSAFEHTPADRVITLRFATPEGEQRLVAEMFGPSGNVYLLGPGDVVKSIALSRKSKNRVGAVYIAPDPPKTSPAPDETEPSPAGEEGGFAFNLEIESKYETLVTADRLVESKAKALAPLRAQLKKLKKRVGALEKEKAVLLNYENHKNIGDLLQANFHQIKKGAAEIVVQNLFTSEAENITITLDPAISPEANARKYYKRHKKFEKGIPRIASDLGGLEDKKEQLTSQMTAIEAVDSVAGVRDFLPSAKEAQGAGKKRGPEKQPAQYSGPKRIISSNGLTMLVGRSDKENDELSFKVANGRDLWLHTRDYPGSHVLVRLDKGATVPRETLLEAAMLALHYSKAAKAGKGEVTYCFAKNLKKPKGAAPGKVMVRNEKSIMVRIDPEAIKRMKTSGT